MIKPNSSNRPRTYSRSGRVVACASLGILCLVLAFNSKAQPSDPLMLTLERKTDEVPPGEVILTATLRNVSKQNVTLNAQDPIVDYMLTVKNEGGVPVPYTKYGQELFSKDLVRITKSIEVRLVPGEIRSDPLVIHDIYSLKVPGQYFASVTRQFWTAEGGGSVSSNTLRILVK